MKRVSTPNSVPDLFGPGKPGYRDGNKAANLNPTELSAADMNAIQEELAAFPEHVGSVVDPNNNHQVLQAVIAMIEARVGDYALDTGVADAYVVALNPAITAYTGNFFWSFKAAHANAGASTVDFGAGPVALNNDVGGALAAGDITAGMVVSGNYSLADNQSRITSMVQSQGDARYASLARGSLEKLGSAVAANSASISFTGINGSLYSQLILIANHVNPSVSANGMVMRISTGAGFIAAGYSDEQLRVINGGSFGGAGGSGASAWNVFPYTEMMGVGSNLNGVFEISDPSSLFPDKRLNYRLSCMSSNSANSVSASGGGSVVANAAPIDGITLLMQSGLIATGNFTLYGVRA